MDYGNMELVPIEDHFDGHPDTIQKLMDDSLRFAFLCQLCTENPQRFRKVISQALTLDEYREAIDKEMAK